MTVPVSELEDLDVARACRHGASWIAREDAELVQHLVGDHVDEHATAFYVDADGEAFGEIPNGPFVALSDGQGRPTES